MMKDEKHGDFFERWQEDRPDKQFRKIKASPIEFGAYGTTYSDSDDHDHDDKIEDASADNCTPVALDGRDINLNEISLKAFHPLLIKYFNKQFHDKKVVWPKRLVNGPREVPPRISL
jgi:hypothetical protein